METFTIYNQIEHTIVQQINKALDNDVLADLINNNTELLIGTVQDITRDLFKTYCTYSTSPERMKALIMALYLLTTAIGDFFGGILYSSIFQTLNRATVMYVCSVLMLGNFGAFCRVAKWWEQCEAKKKAERSIEDSDTESENLGGTSSSFVFEMKTN